MYRIQANFVLLIKTKFTEKCIEESKFNIKERADN